MTLVYPSRASYYDDWLDAFRSTKALNVETANIFRGRERRRIARTIADVDLVVLLHACTADTLVYLEPLVPALSHRRGKLLAFIGNELNLPWAGLSRKISLLREVQADIVATQLPLEAGKALYGSIGGTVLALPHALNEKVFRPEGDPDARALDLGTRSFRYLPYLGDDDRNRIYDYFLEHHRRLGLTIDFSNVRRFTRKDWAQFLNRCKGTVSTEAGSWFVMPDDSLVGEIRDYLAAKHDKRTVRSDAKVVSWARRLPYPVKAFMRSLMPVLPIRLDAAADADEKADYEDVFERFFADRPRPPYWGKCISSRHFDAIGTKTVQIMFPGRFNDILEADRHYIAVSRDFLSLIHI